MKKRKQGVKATLTSDLFSRVPWRETIACHSLESHDLSLGTEMDKADIFIVIFMSQSTTANSSECVQHNSSNLTAASDGNLHIILLECWATSFRKAVPCELN